MDTEPLSWRTSYTYGPKFESISITCPDFMKMSAGEQDELFKQLSKKTPGVFEGPIQEMKG